MKEMQIKDDNGLLVYELTAQLDLNSKRIFKYIKASNEEDAIQKFKSENKERWGESVRLLKEDEAIKYR